MKCERCKFPIYKGFEVIYQQKLFHAICAAEQAKIKPVPETVHRTKRNQFRLIAGGKK